MLRKIRSPVKLILTFIKRQLIILRHIIRKEDVENLILTWHIECQTWEAACNLLKVRVDGKTSTKTDGNESNVNQNNNIGSPENPRSPRS